MNNILLIGYMGTGKTVISKKLSDILCYNIVDTDMMITNKEGLQIPEIFAVNGEEYFRDSETNALKELYEKRNFIISCGGGIVLRDENVLLMKAMGTIVLLTAKAETIFDRVKNSNNRPLLNNNMNVDYIAKMLESRKEKYLAAADIIIGTDEKDIEDIANEIIYAVEKKEKR